MMRTQHQRQRWIALFAIFALLLGQNVSVAHVCMRSIEASPDAVMHAGSSHSHASDASAAMACPHSGAPATSACTVHCADHAKDSQTAKAPAVPILSGVVGWSLVERLESMLIVRVGVVDMIRNADNRRLHEFCTLLI